MPGRLHACNLRDQALDRIAQKDNRLVAAGNETVEIAGQRADVSLLLYFDGRAWQRSSLGGSPFSGFRITALHSDDRFFFAAAAIGSHPTRRATLWRSKDGAIWTPLEINSSELSAGTQSDIGTILSWRGALIAAGSVVEKGTNAKIYKSDDRGDSWTAIESDVFSAEKEGLSIRAMCSGDSRLWAVGLGFDRFGEHPAVWTSSDGKAWERVEVRTVAGRDVGLTGFNSCAATEDILAVVGGANSSYRIFVSNDGGRRWTYPSGELSPTSSSAANGVLSARGKILVFGRVSEGGVTKAMVWASADGEQWPRLGPTPILGGERESTAILSASAVGGQLTVAGYRDMEPAVAIRGVD